MDQKTYAKKIVSMYHLLQTKPLTPRSLAGQMHIGIASAYRRLEALEDFLRRHPTLGTLKTKPHRQGERGPAGKAYFITRQ